MSFIQNIFSSRDNGANASTYIGQSGRIWFDPITNAFYSSDGATPGGLPIGSAGLGGTVAGSNTQIQFNNEGNFGASPNLSFDGTNLMLSGATFKTTLDTVPPIVASLVLDTIVDFSTSPGDDLLPPAYGLTHTVAAPWSVFQFTSTPTPSLEVNDVVSGVDVPLNSEVLFVGSGGNSSVVITSKTFDGLLTPLPTHLQTIAIVRPVVQSTLTISTPDDTNISLNAGVNGHIIIAGSLIPAETNSYDIGTPLRRFKSSYFGPGTIYILDETNNVDIALNARDGNLIVEGATGIHAGNITIFNSNITYDAVGNLNIGNIGSPEYIHFNQPIGVGNIKFADSTVQNTAYVPGNVVTYVSAGVGLTGGGTGNIGLDATGVSNVVSASASQIIVSDSGGKNLTLSLPQNLTTNSSLTFANLTITGTLTVSNLVTSGNAIVDSKILNLAANSTAASQIDAGGIILGNIANTWKRSILYDLANDRWDTDGAGLNTLALTSLAANVTTLHVQYESYFGAAYSGMDFANAPIQIDSNFNSFSQVIQKNHSSGTNASADFVAANDAGTDAVNYIDIGINSTMYSNVDYSITGPSDGYLFVNGGDLVIGTQTAAKNIVFHTGGTTDAAIRARISDKLQVYGNIVVVDGADNELVKLTTDSSIVFGGSQTISMSGGFFVSSLSTGNSEGNIVTYNSVTHELVYGPQLKDYAGNLKAGNLTVVNSANVGNLTSASRVTGTHYGSGAGLTSIPGANVTGTVASAVVSASANAVAGANVTGQVANALLAGTVYTNAQPNITSVGTLTTLAVTGVTNLDGVANVRIAGGANGQFLQTNGSGNLVWGTPSVTFAGASRSTTGSTTIDFSADKLILIYEPTTNVVLTLANYAPGAQCRVLVRLTTKRTIALGIAGVINSTEGVTLLPISGAGGHNIGGNQTVQLVYSCYDNTAANCYVACAYL